MCKGFAKIPRRLFDTAWWNKKRVFTEVDAILDLYNQANVRDRTNPNGKKIRRNQLVTSQRTLADRWIWNQPKVLRFLNKLQSDGWIRVASDKYCTIITILDCDTSESQKESHDESPNESQSVSPEPQCLEGFQSVDVSPNVSPDVSQGESHDESYFKNIRREDNNNNMLFDVPEQYPFKDFWDLYDKKVDIDACKKLYGKLSMKDRKAIFDYVPKYKEAQPDKQFRQGPARFLRNRSWENEIIHRDSARVVGIASKAAQVDNNQEKFKSDKQWKL